MQSGIYLITCARPGQLPLYYVGQSHNLRAREGQHRAALKYNRHHNDHLQRAWDKYGANAFSWQVLEKCPAAGLDEIEQWWLDEIAGHPRCMNLAMFVGSIMRGRSFTDDHKEKIRAAISGDRHYNFGKSLSQEHRANISAGGKGKLRGAVTKARISAANIGANNSMYGKRGAQNARSCRVQATSIETGEVRVFDSMQLAVEHGFLQSEISRACRGLSKYHKGHTWKFAT